MHCIEFISTFAKRFKMKLRDKYTKKIKMSKQSVIWVSHGESKQLAAIFQKSYPTIRKALRGEVDNELARRIRTAALRRGGKELAQVN